MSDIEAGDDLTLHVAEGGQGTPLLLLHGFTGSVETWEHLRARFEENHHVIAIDLPGHGRSSSPADPERYSLLRTTDDIACSLDEIGVERTAVLGYSMGGRLALHFALRHPDRVTALILESTSPGLSDATLRDERRESDRDLADFIEREGMTAFVDRWESLSLWETQGHLPASTRAELRAQRLRGDPRGFANSLRGAGQAATASVEDELQRISIPTLLIAGALDLKYRRIAHQMEQSMPNARAVIVPGAGHTVHLEQPEAFSTATLDFLRV